MLIRSSRTSALRGLAVIMLGGVLLAGCATNGSARNQGAIELERMLSAADFRRAGLEQLSDEQLATLNALLTRELTDARTADPQAVAAWERSGEDIYATFGLDSEHPEAQAREEMSSHLVGELDGWENGRRIQLENGQVWEVVTSPTRMFGNPVADVPVTVERAFMGSFKMWIGDMRPAVRVRRVE